MSTGNGGLIDTLVRPAAWMLDRKYMKLLGSRRTMRIAKRYNAMRHGRYQDYRRRMYQEQFDELIRENGQPQGPVLEMKDGWAMDTSGRFPHTQRLLEEAEQVIAERGGVVREHFGRPFFQDIFADEHLERYPSFLDFATSSDLLIPVCRHLGFIPQLPNALPRGIRLNESSEKFNDEPGAPPRASQMHHIDPYNVPNVYVIVAVRDITEESGPFCFLPAAESQRVAEAIDYGARGVPYRIPDEQIYAVTDESKLIRFAAPAGSVLFVDPGACFHFGSRNCVVPRYQIMYGFCSPVRCDFADLLHPQLHYPVRDDDSRLRKMVLDRKFTG